MNLRIDRFWRRSSSADDVAEAQPGHAAQPGRAAQLVDAPDDQPPVDSRAGVSADPAAVGRSNAEARVVAERFLAVEDQVVCETTALVEGLAVAEGAAPPNVQPEQPVVLAPARPGRVVRAGEVLPAGRSRALLARLPVPNVPKRAILAAGVCAGLAAPGITRHVATRLLFGSSATRTGLGALEITRITYTGPITSEAISIVTRALERTGR